MNALCSSGLLTVPELKRFGLNHPRVGWKRVYDSAHERMATFLEATSKYMELFHRKLIITRVDERLTVAIYVPKKIERSQDCLVDNHVRVFAFPHNQGAERQSRLCLPTKMNYRLYSDDNTFQLFEQQRSNTWIHIRHGGSDDSSYRGKANTGDRRRQRQETLDQGQNFDFIVSVALNKFSQGLLTHIGRVNRNAVHAAEVYVITNRDVQSMEKLDRWLQYIDTDEVMPLFNEEPNEYSIPTIASVDLALEPKYIACIAREDLSILSDIDSEEQLSHLFTWLYENDARDLLLKAVDYLFDRIAEPGPALAPSAVLNVVFSTLEHSPFLSVCFSRIDNWTDLPGDLGTQIENRAPDIIRGFILSANNAQELVLDPMRKTFSQIGSMSSGIFAELVELVALTVRSPGLALDILLECFEPEANRLLESLDPLVMENFKKNLIGTAMDHIGEVDEEAKDRDDLLSLKLHTEQMDRNAVVISTFRIDSPGGTPEASAHVRLTVASPPMNTSLRRLYSMDALVTYSEKGMARFRCLHPLPPYFEKCSWRLTYGASFVTTKAMLTAITAFAANPEAHCPIWSLVLGMPSSHSQPVSSPLAPDATETAISLNASQRAAVKATLESPLVCLWGPPGTGKTQTIAAAIVGLEKLLPKARILITAPTHNAVDNVMRRYLSIAKPENQSVLRISTEVS
ncbi:hypothetical protein GGS20DRAFT_452035 [Poronia punctata]|nr:hypothetical protein GGS20DRAFT_452035 [Poronia punctata]